ncbi:MAG: AsmA family protein, partial [Halieaceae bacterium]
LLRRNLSSSHLSASAVMVYTSDTDAAENPSPLDWLSYVRWLPRHLSIGTMHVISNDVDVWIFPLKNLEGSRAGERRFDLTAAADYEGEPLEIELSLLGTRNETRFTGMQLTAEVVAPVSKSIVKLSGEVQASQTDFNYDLAVDADYKRISDFLEGFERAANVINGSLKLTGHLTGNLDGYTISAEQVIIDNMPDYGFEASGQLVRMRNQDAEISLVAAGELASTAQLTKVAGIDFSALGRAQANVKLSGSIARPRIEEFIVITRNDEGLAINMSGKLSFGELKEGEPVEGNEIRIDASGPSLKSIEPWIGVQAFETGPWFSSSRISGTREGFTMKDFILGLGTPDTASFRAEGIIESIDPRQPFTLAKVTGIDLSVTAATEDTAILGEWFELDLPSYHAATGKALIRGSGDDVTISEGFIDIESSDLEARISDIELRVVGIETLEFSEFGAQLTLELSDTSALSQYLDREFISLGPISAVSTLTQRGDHYGLEGIELQVHSDGLTMELGGSIEHVLTLEGTDLEMNFSGVDTRTTLTTLLEDFSHPTQLGTLAGHVTIRNPQNRWQLVDLMVDNVGSEAIAFSLEGELNDLNGFTTGDLDSRFNIRDTKVLRTATGFAVAPTKGEVTVKTKPGVVAITSSLQAGSTTINSDATVGHDRTEITSVTANVKIPHLLLKDLGLQADTASSNGYNPSEQLDPLAKQQDPRSLLERTPKYPTDLELSIGAITGENLAVEGLDIHTTGENGRYTLRKLNLGYASGKAEVRGIIDLNPQPIAISLAGQGITLPLNKLGADLGMNTDVEGILSFQGGLLARGTEREQLLSSLSGSLAVALQDAVIEGAAYDVLATSVLEWIYSGASREKSTNIDCTMAKFNINSGVARSKNLFIESERMVATGKVEIDLKRQRLDATIEPLSKSRRFQIPASVRLRGDLDSPKVITSPIKATANASAEALMLIPSLTMKIFGIKRSEKEQARPCETSNSG